MVLDCFQRLHPLSAVVEGGSTKEFLVLRSISVGSRGVSRSPSEQRVSQPSKRPKSRGELL